MGQNDINDGSVQLKWQYDSETAWQNLLSYCDMSKYLPWQMPMKYKVLP